MGERWNRRKGDRSKCPFASTALVPLVLLFGVPQLRISAWSPFQSRAMGRQLIGDTSRDKKWFFVGVIALTFGIPRAIEAQRQTPPSQSRTRMSGNVWRRSSRSWRGSPRRWEAGDEATRG